MLTDVGLPLNGGWGDRVTEWTRGMGAITTWNEANAAAVHGDTSDPRFMALVAQYKADQNKIWAGALQGVNAMYAKMRQDGWNANRQYFPQLPPTPLDDWNPLVGMNPYIGWTDINQLTSSGIEDLAGINLYLQNAGFTDYLSMGTHRIDRPGPQEMAGDWVQDLYPYMTPAEQEAARFMGAYVPPATHEDFPGDTGISGDSAPFNPYDQTVTTTFPDGSVATHHGPWPMKNGAVDWSDPSIQWVHPAQTPTPTPGIPINDAPPPGMTPPVGVPDTGYPPASPPPQQAGNSGVSGMGLLALAGIALLAIPRNRK